MESNAPDPVMYIPDDDPAVFVFADDDMLAPLLAPERPLMNIYEVDAGEHSYVEEYIDEWARHEYMRAITVVAAPSRSKARQLVVAHFNYAPYYLYLEFTQKMSIHLLHKNVECGQGVDAASEWLCQHDPRCVELDAVQDAV